MESKPTELTVEQALRELREMFPVLSVSVNIYANWITERRDSDFATIRMFGASPPTSHTREFNATSLGEAMQKVRDWKAQQQ